MTEEQRAIYTEAVEQLRELIEDGVDRDELVNELRDEF